MGAGPRLLEAHQKRQGNVEPLSPVSPVPLYHQPPLFTPHCSPGRPMTKLCRHAAQGVDPRLTSLLPDIAEEMGGAAARTLFLVASTHGSARNITENRLPALCCAWDLPPAKLLCPYFGALFRNCVSILFSMSQRGRPYHHVRHACRHS